MKLIAFIFEIIKTFSERRIKTVNKAASRLISIFEAVSLIASASPIAQAIETNPLIDGAYRRISKIILQPRLIPVKIVAI